MVGADTNSLDENLWKLFLVQASMGLLPLSVIWLLPPKKRVEKLQKVIDFMEKDARDEINLEERDKKIKQLDADLAKSMGIVSHKKAEQGD